MPELTIASRASNLALRQAEILKSLLPVESKIASFKTEGDRILDMPLQEIGGKGLFTKEIDEAVISGRAQVAVHSMKDMETEISGRLQIAAILPRADCRDAFVSPQFGSLAELPEGAIVGTSSLRRQAQILHKYPHLQVQPLRGNVETRLKKLKAGEIAATILAVAGLERLGLESEITQIMDNDAMLPAVAQGALAITCHANDDETAEVLESLNDAETAICVMAERAFLRRLDGSCRTPIAALATLDETHMTFEGLLASEDGKKLVRKAIRCHIDSAIINAEDLADNIRQEFDG